jgi:hypothetical protein
MSLPLLSTDLTFIGGALKTGLASPLNTAVVATAGGLRATKGYVAATPLPSWNEHSTLTKVGAGVVVGVATVALAPVALGAVGFGSAGVAAGSIAAGVQGAVVTSGSWFAICQAVGATGSLFTVAPGLAVTTGAVAGGATYGAIEGAEHLSKPRLSKL